MSFAEKIFGTFSDRELKKINPLTKKVLALEPQYQAMSDADLQAQTPALKERLAKGEGKGRVWCTIHAKALPVQQFFKALRYRELRPAEQENGSVPRNELVYEHTLS